MDWSITLSSDPVKDVSAARQGDTRSGSPRRAAYCSLLWPFPREIRQGFTWGGPLS